MFKGKLMTTPIFSEYLHLRSNAMGTPNVRFRTGRYVTDDTVVGYTGNTGESDGAHIHSGVYVLKDNNPLYIWLRNNNYELVNKTRGWFYNPYELERRNLQWQEN